MMALCLPLFPSKSNGAPRVIAVVKPQPGKAEDWYARLLMQSFKDHRPLRTLVLSTAPDELRAAGVNSASCVRFARGEKVEWHAFDGGFPGGPGYGSEGLPFQVDVFDLVVLHGCVTQGDVRALAAVRRCMPVGSRLLVMAQAWMNPRRLRKTSRQAPALRTGWARRRLAQLGFDLRVTRGRGVAGTDLVLDHGPARLLQPFADRLAFEATRRDSRHNIRLVRFSTPRVVMGQGAAWDGVNREAAS